MHNPVGFFDRNLQSDSKIYLKMHVKCKDPRRTQIILTKKNKAEILSMTDFKTF